MANRAAILAITALCPALMFCLGGEDPEEATASIAPALEGTWRTAGPAGNDPFSTIELAGCEFEAFRLGEAPWWGTFEVAGGPRQGTIRLSIIKAGRGRLEPVLDRLWRFSLDTCYSDGTCGGLTLSLDRSNPPMGLKAPTIHLTRGSVSAGLGTFQDSRSNLRQDLRSPLTCTQGREVAGGVEMRADCDLDPSFAEVDLLSDHANCGACGHVCGGVPTVASSICVRGLCEVAACLPSVASPRASYADCDGQGSNGCEVTAWGAGCVDEPDVKVSADRADTRYVEGAGEAWIAVRLEEAAFPDFSSTALRARVSLFAGPDKDAYALDLYEGSCARPGDATSIPPEGKVFEWADGFLDDSRTVLLHVRDLGGGAACIRWSLNVEGATSW